MRGFLCKITASPIPLPFSPTIDRTAPLCWRVWRYTAHSPGAPAPPVGSRCSAPLQRLKRYIYLTGCSLSSVWTGARHPQASLAHQVSQDCPRECPQDILRPDCPEAPDAFRQHHRHHHQYYRSLLHIAIDMVYCRISNVVVDCSNVACDILPAQIIWAVGL